MIFAGIWHTLFAWPQGIVVGNLIASALWAIPAFAHLHWLNARRHRALMRRATQTEASKEWKASDAR